MTKTTRNITPKWIKEDDGFLATWKLDDGRGLTFEVIADHDPHDDFELFVSRPGQDGYTLNRVKLGDYPTLAAVKRLVDAIISNRMG